MRYVVIMLIVALMGSVGCAALPTWHMAQLEGLDASRWTQPAAEAEHGEAAAGHGEGPNPFAGSVVTAILTLAIFVVLLFVLGKWAWGPILAGLQKREEHIREYRHSVPYGTPRQGPCFQGGYRCRLARV